MTICRQTRAPARRRARRSEEASLAGHTAARILWVEAAAGSAFELVGLDQGLPAEGALEA